MSHGALGLFYRHDRDVVQTLTPPAGVSNIGSCSALTAVELVPLTLSVCRLVDCAHPQRLQHVDLRFGSPFTSAVMALLLTVIFYHMRSIQVVVEDEVQRDRNKIPTVVMIRLSPSRSQ